MYEISYSVRDYVQLAAYATRRMSKKPISIVDFIIELELNQLGNPAMARKPGDDNYSLREARLVAEIKLREAKLKAKDAEVKAKDALIRELRAKLSLKN